ncbi:hypothetical protein [Snodgrassella sp. ESL0253]|uniref:hypothetical protein n=1 Tax=Snodgrassella sp. ESL0253 TaxID=2705031 RepID=UPI001583B5CD|nr:hypothetical protein [Snodgrassella sp. ESL0253]NUE67661.1 hypothetical protein [Snodgrassella sp. ESL0253]
MSAVVVIDIAAFPELLREYMFFIFVFFTVTFKSLAPALFMIVSELFNGLSLVEMFTGSVLSFAI